MLTLTQLAGFGGGGGGVDATPNPIDFNNVMDSGVTASGGTNIVTITGIDTTITLRLTLSAAMTGWQGVTVFRDGVFVSQVFTGTTLDVSVMNGQTLQYLFTNALDYSTWAGTATVTNLSDGGATLDTFSYTLQDTGDGGGGVDVVVTF